MTGRVGIYKVVIIIMIQYSEESLESRWYREHSIRIHMKRLKDIKERSSSVVQSPIRFSSVNRSRLGKPVLKHYEMVKQNIMLYDKLTHISERRHNKGQLKGPRSLNISIRKKEADRIIQDNFEFVKRLTERESMFSVTKLKKEYDIQEKYKSSISRHNLHERLKKITESELKLPPILQESGGKGSSTSRVSQGSKGNSKSQLKNSSSLPRRREGEKGEGSVELIPKQRNNLPYQQQQKFGLEASNPIIEPISDELKLEPCSNSEPLPGPQGESNPAPLFPPNEPPENNEKKSPKDPPKTPEPINT